VIGWINQYSNLVVLQTLSKAWGLAAARVGLAFASPEIISIMNKVKFPYNVGKPSMNIALSALKQEEAMKARVRETLETRGKLADDLENLPQVVKVYPSDANYLLVKFKESQKVYRKLASNGIVVRDRGSQPGCEGCLRITVGTREEVEKLLNTLKQF
ncbi:MAG: aminotransferase class I/II-fold pyridoxal phosphate-dependent enzyme, partial [Bacteroidales bacterium]